jgi:predicted nucleotidyltransferase
MGVGAGNCGIIRTVNRADTIALLLQHKPELQRRFGVVRLALFGSRAREQARDDGDADILVTLDGPADSARYFSAQFYLEDLLGCPVDLVTEEVLRPQLRPFVERDAIHV